VRLTDTREAGVLKLRVHAVREVGQARLTADIAVSVASHLPVDGSAAGSLTLRGLRAGGSWSAEGAVRLVDVGGEIRVHCDSGDALAEDCHGLLHLHVACGSGEVRQASGHVELTCLDGDVRLDGVSGDTRLVVPDGRVTGHRLSGRLEVRGGVGDVALTDVSVEDLVVVTGAGAVLVEAAVPRGSRLVLQSRGGDVTLRVPHETRARVCLRGRTVQCGMPLENDTRDRGYVGGVLGEADAMIDLTAEQGTATLAWQSVAGQGTTVSA